MYDIFGKHKKESCFYLVVPFPPNKTQPSKGNTKKNSEQFSTGTTYQPSSPATFDIVRPKPSQPNYYGVN